MKQVEQSYEEYKDTQTKYNKLKINNCWVQESTIEKIREVLPLEQPKILCHGTRRGVEQQLFRRFYPGCEVLGTEISDTASEYPDTIQWDFHETHEGWCNYWDIIYTNSLDHALKPQRAIRNWLGCLKQDGTLIIEWTGDNEKATIVDVFGAKLQEVIDVVNKRQTGGMVVDVVNLVPKKEKYKYQSLIICKKWTYPELSEEELSRKVEHIFEVNDILSSIGLEYYLGGSTLLGCVRDGDIVKHGSGVTFHFKAEVYHEYEKVMKRRFLEAGFEIKEVQTKSENGKIQVQKGGFLFELVAWYKTKRGREYFYRVRRNYRLPKEIFKPGGTITLRGKKIPCFSPPEEYCFFRFVNWRTPGINSRNRESFENERYNRK
jgi:hypothetical protein